MTTFLAHLLRGSDLLCSGTAWDQTHVALLRHFCRNTSILTLSSRLHFGSLCNIPYDVTRSRLHSTYSGGRRAGYFGGRSNVGKIVRVLQVLLILEGSVQKGDEN
jgi:hypothetical protein